MRSEFYLHTLVNRVYCSRCYSKSQTVKERNKNSKHTPMKSKHSYNFSQTAMSSVIVNDYKNKQ